MKQKIVVDSSVIVKWINNQNEDHLSQANKLLQDAQSQAVVLYTPVLAHYEIGNALLKKGLDLQLAYNSLETAYMLPIEFIDEDENLAKETYTITRAARDSGLKQITYYDSSFVALAKQKEATLVTDNPKHQKLIKGAKVIALGDYQ